MDIRIFVLGVRVLVSTLTSKTRALASLSHTFFMPDKQAKKGAPLPAPPPRSPSRAVLQHVPVWTFKVKVWSYGVWYCCAPARPRDAAVFSRFNEVIEGKILRGLVLLYPLPLFLYCSTLPFDMKVEGMILRGLVLLCNLPPT